MPDSIVITAYQEAQARAGVPDLDELLDRRAVLVDKYRHAAAMYEDNRVWDSERKRRLSLAAIKVRDEYITKGDKFTEPIIDAKAHVHKDYTDWLDKSNVERAEYLVGKNEIEGITEHIRRGNLIFRMLTNEPRV